MTTIQLKLYSSDQHAIHPPLGSVGTAPGATRGATHATPVNNRSRSLPCSPPPAESPPSGPRAFLAPWSSQPVRANALVIQAPKPHPTTVHPTRPVPPCSAPAPSGLQPYPTLGDAVIANIVSTCPSPEALSHHAQAADAALFVRAPHEKLINFFQGFSGALVMLVQNQDTHSIFVRKVEWGAEPRVRAERDLLLRFLTSSDPRYQQIARAYPAVYAAGDLPERNAVYMDMEYIPSWNAGEWLLKHGGTPEALWRYLTPLLDLALSVPTHAIDAAEQNNVLSTYLHLLHQRLDAAVRIAQDKLAALTAHGAPPADADTLAQLRAFIFYTKQPAFMLNDRKCTNPSAIMDQITPGTSLWARMVPHVLLDLGAHGDWTISNTLIPKEPGANARFIDNRGNNKAVDPALDLGKMLFSMEGFAAIGLGRYTLSLGAANADHAPNAFDGLAFSLQNATDGDRALQAVARTFVSDFLQNQPAMQRLHTQDPDTALRTKLYAHGQFIADLLYRINISPRDAMADWCMATLLLNAFAAELELHPART